MVASLEAEPSNAYDPGAIRVLVNGTHVGYLSRDDAARYSVVLATVRAAGYAAEVVGRAWTVARRSFDGRGQSVHATLRLDLDSPHLVLPVNNPPEQPSSLIPWGSAVQLQGEENHREAIAAHVRPDGTSIALGTLRVTRTTPQRAAPKSIVEVRIDGEKVGTLTPAMSAHFVPTVEHLRDQGLASLVWLKVTGTPIAAQITLHAKRAHEIPGDWFTGVTTLPALYPRRSWNERDDDDDDDLASDVESIRRDMARDATRD